MTVEDIPLSPRMGQCSITGKLVPEDELVTIQGHIVCAEGKAILLERLKSGEMLPGEVETPTFWRRFGCMFIDGLIVGVPTAIATNVIGGAPAPGTFVPAGYVAVGVVSLVAVVLEIVYFGQMHGVRGQTVGKMAGKLFVVNLDGSPVSLKTAYVRAVAYIGPSILSGLAYFTGNLTVVVIAGVVAGAYWLTNVLFALCDRNMQRALHDRIAGTRVIMKD